MARFLCQAKLLAASVADGSSLIIGRRGYAAASHASVSASYGRGGPRSGILRKAEEIAAIKEESGVSSAWVPDPVTGYYRPISHAAEIDAVELREMLLKPKDQIALN